LIVSVVVKNIETFPTHNTLAVADIKLHSLLVITGVRLKLDDQSDQYYVEFTSAEDEHGLVELCDDALKDKVYDDMVFKYEEHIKSLFLKENADKLPYIYQLERKRIEENEYQQYYT